MIWIKLSCGFMDNRKIKMIRKGPEGDSLALLWIFLLIEAGKCNRGGYLMITDGVPYTEETISMVTDVEIQTVRLGLALYGKLGMIDQIDSCIYITNWGKHQSEEKLEVRRRKDRERKQKQRERERKQINLSSPAGVTSRDKETDGSRDVTLESRGDEKKNKGFVSAEENDEESMSKMRAAIWDELSANDKNYYLNEVDKIISGVSTYPDIGKEITAKQLALDAHLGIDNGKT